MPVVLEPRSLLRVSQSSTPHSSVPLLALPLAPQYPHSLLVKSVLPELMSESTESRIKLIICVCLNISFSHRHHTVATFEFFLLEMKKFSQAWLQSAADLRGPHLTLHRDKALLTVWPHTPGGLSPFGVSKLLPLFSSAGA